MPAGRLCRDAQADTAVRAAVERAVGFLRDRLGPRLVGLILTGSFSRGEGTVIALQDGRRRVLGDVEFLVVLPRGRDYRALRPAFARWSREAGPVLGGPDLDVDLEFGPVEEAYLRAKARPSIFVHDLRAHGRVIAGPRDLLQRIPAFTAADIPREDALHLLFNRTIEQLEAWDHAETLEGPALLDAAYQRVKLTLDLAGSALAFDGRHVTSYAARPAAFDALLTREPALAALLPAGFAEELARAARLKLAPDAGELLPPGPPDARRKWVRAEIEAAVPAMAALLRWELSRLLGGDAPLPSLLARWTHATSWRQRARQWVKLALHPMPAPLPLSAPRAAALAWRSTPRALVYTAGALAYLALA
ncbi:MAG TPA: hypothetical protein VFL90_06185, partial [Methylomirabilota bacterium]|nr:hypothetical protein [Methylomirabilota bacterium]